MINTRRLIVAELMAFWNWFSEEGLTPHLVCTTDGPEIDIPAYLKERKHMVLNISSAATSDLLFGDAGVSCQVAFGGRHIRVFIPYENVLGMKAAEFPDTVGMFAVVDYRRLSEVLNAADMQATSDTTPRADAVSEGSSSKERAVPSEGGAVVVDFTKRRKT